jgi:hypothetical protein
MGSLEKAIQKLAEFKTAQRFKDLFEDEETILEEDEFDETILESDKEEKEEFWEEEFDIKESPVPYGILSEDNTDTSFSEGVEASKNTKNLLKIAIKLEKLGVFDSRFEEEDLPFDWDEEEDYIETAVTPTQIDAWDEEDIPDEYKMQQLSDEDIGSILGMEPEGAFVEDPLTGKKHYDVEPDISLLDEDFEEKVSEAPTEVEDFIRQMELELAKAK